VQDVAKASSRQQSHLLRPQRSTHPLCRAALGTLLRSAPAPPTSPAPCPLADAGAPSGSGSLWHGLSPAAPRPKCDSALYHELLRSSNGDHSLVATRLADMGFSPADYAEQQQQQQSIKAVGGGASGLAARWAHTLPTKESLKRSPGTPRFPTASLCASRASHWHASTYTLLSCLPCADAPSCSSHRSLVFVLLQGRGHPTESGI
jgi:hypothetical protein